MADIALQWQRTSADTDVVLGDLVADDTLQTAIIISLFSDRRANEDDRLPDGESDPRGWWGDVADDVLTGSRLWLLSREKVTPDVRRRAELYAAESLRWMIDDGIAQTVEVSGEFMNRQMLALTVTIKRPGRDAEIFRYSYNWEAQAYAILPA